MKSPALQDTTIDRSARILPFDLPPWRLSFSLALSALLLSTASWSQEIGVPTQVDLVTGRATLSLDFADQDYQLILYSALRDEPDSSRSYSFTVAGAFPSAKPVIPLAHAFSPVTADRKGVLRREEADLARTIRKSGGVSYAAKRAQAFQIGSARTFLFEEFGDVSEQSVTATLIATSSRADAWIDNNTTGITVEQIQSQIDRFSDDTYPIVTSVFGAASDVDGDGKVLFLYTSLVDDIGTVSGFYRARSLFSMSDGGDGNRADMMYIGVDHSDSFYESLLAHEFQHLINFNQHVLVHDGMSEISSMNEALSHISEDLIDQHTQGGNPDNVRTYSESPSIYSILAESAHDSGVRGTAYTFARSMMESFGEDIPTRLVQTERSGIANVENVSNQSFEDVYETYLSRMFLAGSGLNDNFDYTYPFFTEPETAGRSIPVPDETALSPEAVTVTGTTKAYAASFLRLMGTGPSTITIDTEPDGEFRSILIPIPRDFRHDIALKRDYFAGITFDAPLTGNFTSGENVRVSGTVSDVANTEILFSFAPMEADADTVRFSSEILNGTFAGNILFPHAAAGAYTLSIFAGLQDESLPFIGRLSNVFVSRGSETFSLPADFFQGITLDSPLAVEQPTAASVAISGAVSDATVDEILFRFDPIETGDTLRFSSPVSAGRFNTPIFIHPSLAGTYDLYVFAGQSSASSLPQIGQFGPFNWIVTGNTFTVPAGFFSGITLTEALPGTFSVGDGITLAGSVDDAAVTQVLFRFEPRDGSDSLRFFVDVAGGVFSKGIVFGTGNGGDYDLTVFTGVAGQSLEFISRFSFVSIKETGFERILIPTNFFDGLTFDSALPTEYYEGQTVRYTGRVDGFLSGQIIFRFDPQDGSASVQLQANVSAGRFDIGIDPQVTGTGVFDLVVFSGDGTSLPFVGSFGPIHVLPAQPRLVLGNSSLTFTATEIGQTSELTLEISNVGSESLTLTSVSVESGPFTASTSATTVAAGGSLTISIIYDPTSAGVETGILKLDSNDPTQPTITINLAGTGLAGDPPPAPQIVIDTSTLAFSETLIGESTTLILTVQNTGDANLVIDSLVVEGPFLLDVNIGPVSAGDSLAVDITFGSQEAAEYTGRLLIFTNAQDSPTEVVLTGTTVTPPDPPVSGGLVGDFDGSGAVDFADFLSFAGAFGTRVGDASYLSDADLDENGSIDFSDFLTFASQFGKSL